ncbi:hypothetical protein Q604_UNBC05778G0001, partial [human gut metagenome]
FIYKKSTNVTIYKRLIIRNETKTKKDIDLELT